MHAALLAALLVAPADALPPRAAWALEAGAGATHAGDAHGTLGHLLVAGRWSSPSRHFQAGPRMSWPGWGGEARTEGGSARFWTWHLGLEAAYSPAPAGWRVRPFLGGGPGLRLLLLDSATARGFQSDTRAQLAGDLRAFLGVDVTVTARATLVLRGDVGHVAVLGGDERPLLGRSERFVGRFFAAAATVLWAF